ncbi:MAG: pteridine reductase [SAR86 cluster bacterium]|uniref:Pteridine reductase n=1 Tax=SAR86 cluster bacterium TaxID=2030880 RepID=A0A2A5CEC1_9GAMM|nr:pteridine reductase [Gammaproteobacteria bacterium AH-315-E17]PCJ41726.1 MAG: pteridine reductase [SAR86 cluster bacterium]
MRTDKPIVKVALITGGAARIGASIARHLHKAGYNIALHYRQSKSSAESLSIELNDIRANSIHCFEADLLKLNDIEQLVKNTLAQWGRLDVLINNASSFYPTPLVSINEEQWHDLIGINAKAPAFLSKACSPALRKSSGCIVNISDIAANTGRKDYLIYTMAKAALATLTKSLAKELAPEVRVNAVAPGAILPPNFSASQPGLGNVEAIVSSTLAVSCLSYPGTVNDIAYAVAFLIQSTYISGQTLTVDGGKKLLS